MVGCLSKLLCLRTVLSQDGSAEPPMTLSNCVIVEPCTCVIVYLSRWLTVTFYALRNRQAAWINRLLTPMFPLVVLWRGLLVPTSPSPFFLGSVG